MLLWVFVAAGVIAAATLIGTLIGYLFKNITQKQNDAVIAFSAGVMLSAAVFGLIEPSLDFGGRFGVFITVAGVFLGAAFLCLIDKLIPKINGLASDKKQGRALLFASAIAIHHLPEGVAVGVSFGTGNVSDIAMVCGSIAIQNIPEAAVIISPMLQSGMSKKKTALVALISGGAEILGTFFGYFAVSVATFIMPVALAFAGGSMLYIIVDEMIPETHSESYGRMATYLMLAGFCTMLVFDFVIGLVAA